VSNRAGQFRLRATGAAGSAQLPIHNTRRAPGAACRAPGCSADQPGL